MKKFPSYIQLDAMDCGPASLRIVAKYYGKNFSTKYLRDKCFITREGVSLFDISNAAENLGFRTLPIKVTYEDLKTKIPLPIIAHWDYKHFVVVYKVKENKVYISDPAYGLVTYNKKEFCDSWAKNGDKGAILVMEPTSKLYNLEGTETPTVFTHFFRYIIPHKKFFVQVLIGMILGILLSLIFPLITQSIIDVGIENRDIDFINILLFASLVLTFSSVLSNFIMDRVMLFVSDRINIAMVSDFLTKLMKLPIPFFERKMVSDVLQRIQDHVRVQDFIMKVSLSMIIAILTFIVYSIIIIFYSRTLFFVFTIGSLLYVGWIILFLKKRRKLDYQSFEATAENQNDFLEIMGSIHEIKVNNISNIKRWQWLKSRLNIYNVNVKMLNLSQVQGVGSTLINQVKNLLITFIAAKSVIDGQMTLGMMLSAQYIIGQLNGPIGKFIGFVQSYQDAKISIERINEVVYEEQEEKRFVGIKNKMPHSKTITLKNVSFSYNPSWGNVLNNISLVIPQGKITAIVGESGSGKTTLMKLLLRFYEPSSGEIKIDKVDLSSIDIDEWREQCGIVLQEGKILNDTLLNNIVLNNEEIDQEKLHFAITSANLTSYIDALPLKLYTILGAGGNGLSSGQKQRVLIARAIYKNPYYFFFDEATNSLDANNEKEITQNLNKIIKDKTAVIIAHRLSTIKNSDNIVVLKDGEIAEQGTHNQLLKKRKLYFNLIKNQLDSVEKQFTV